MKKLMIVLVALMMGVGVFAANIPNKSNSSLNNPYQNTTFHLQNN